MKVLLVRVDGIGDALACTPLVAALRDGGHELGALLGSENNRIFAARSFARVHVVARIPWPAHGSTPDSARRALEDVRAAGYDVALIASEEIDAYQFAHDARIARRVGFLNGWEKPFKSLHVRTMLTRAIVRPASAARAREHEVETLFRLGDGLIAERTPGRDPKRLAPLVLDEPAPGHGRVVLQVTRKLAGAGLDREAYVSLANALAGRGRAVLALGDDASLVHDVGRAGGCDYETGLDLGAWKRAIAGGAALVTPDSGAAHVAGMTGVPCVDCFAPGASTAFDILRWRPWAAPHRVVVLDPARPRAQSGRELAGAVDDLLARAPAVTR
jgi:ADP-heptose:LPS heptosyltransferase